jgi:hypothetical protein
VTNKLKKVDELGRSYELIDKFLLTHLSLIRKTRCSMIQYKILYQKLHIQFLKNGVFQCKISTLNLFREMLNCVHKIIVNDRKNIILAIVHPMS